MKQQKAKKDIILMLFLIAVSLVLITWIIPNYITVTKLMEMEVFTPRTFPKLIAYGLLAVSSLGLISAVVRYISAVNEEGRQKKAKKTKSELKEALFPYLIYALIIAFVLVYTFFGIVPAIIIVPPVILWFLRCRNWKSYVAFYIFATIIYLLFTQVLGVPIK